MFTDGAIISAVCHGGAIFPGIINSSTGKSIIDGKKVTGFTTKGEEEEGVLDTIKSWNRPTIEKAAAEAGATCKCEWVNGEGEEELTFARYFAAWTVGCVYIHGWNYCHGRESG